MSRAARANLTAVAIAFALIAGLLAIRAARIEDPLARLAVSPAGERQAHDGSWWIPRGGPTVLGFESSGPAELSLDGRVVARGTGVVAERVVLEAGARSVRLVAPRGTRLLWEPVGRRGPSEYVSPSSLSPEPPARAAFDAPGTARLDGVLAGAVLAVVLALVGFLARARLRRLDRATTALAGLVFALALAVRLIDLGGAGQTWDEDTNWSAGRNYVTNLLALDFSESSWRFNLEHPPLSKYVYGIGAQLADGYGPARALAALMMALACALIVPIGRRLHGLRAGALGGLIAALTPHLIAHGKVVGHEAPSALAWAAIVLACVVAHDGLAGERRAANRQLAIRFAVIGVLFGLALSVRFVNGLAAPLIGLLLVLGAPAGERRRTIVLGLGIPLVAVVVAVVLWPRLWSSPLEHLAESWAILRKPHGVEPYLGELTNRPGLAYFPLYLLATAPVVVLGGALAWVVRAVRRREPGSLALALWLLVPLTVALSPVRQDGVRYVVPALLALALAAGVGLDGALDALFDAIARRATPRWLARLVPQTNHAVMPPLARLATPAWPRRLTVAAAVLLVGYLGATAARIHPYYLDYYGEQVGGPATVARHRWFETAWWGEGLAAALAVLAARAPDGARVHKGCVEPSHLAWLRADLWRDLAIRVEDADWIVVYAPTSRPCRLPPDAVLIHEVDAQGAPLARLYRRGEAR